MHYRSFNPSWCQLILSVLPSISWLCSFLWQAPKILQHNPQLLQVSYKDEITILLIKKFISQDWKTPHEWGDVHSFVQATFSSFTFSFISSYYVSLFPFLLGNTSKTYPSPPYSLSRKSFAKKNLSGNGGLTPLPLTENCQKCYYKNGSKRAKIGVFGQK